MVRDITPPLYLAISVSRTNEYGFELSIEYRCVGARRIFPDYMGICQVRFGR